MHTTSTTPDDALKMLLDGNWRYANGLATHPRQAADRRAEVVAGQRPFAMLLSCSDSRVPPEVLFDQGIGDLFVIRNAGSIIDNVVLGSLEYGAEHLGVNLVMVLGHTKCGAVTAAVQGGKTPGHIGSVVNAIRPAVAASQGQIGDAVLNATIANVRLTVNAIRSCEPILAELIRKDQLKVVGGLYHLDAGVVDLVG